MPLQKKEVPPMSLSDTTIQKFLTIPYQESKIEPTFDFLPDSTLFDIF